MNYKLLGTVIVSSIGFYTNSYAQQEHKPIKSREIIQEGIRLNDDKKYDEAIAEFKKIERNDSLFALASVELINTYSSDKKDSLAVILCDELLKHSDQYTPNILLSKANALDNLKRTKEAEDIYKLGAKNYPLNNRFIYELGVAKLRQEKFYEAYQYFVQSLKINPFHPASHFQMGNLALKQGKIIPAMLAWQFYLVCDNKSKRASSVINSLEALAKLEVNEDKTIEITEIKNENDFAELESVLRSKIALSDKYKSKIDMNFAVVKQMQLICENIGKYQEVTGFYNDFYGKFFTNIWTSKYFEPYVYNAFSGAKNEAINKWVSKNEKELEAFKQWSYNYVCTKEAVYNENLNGITKSVPHWFSYNKLYAAGERNAQNNNEGYWNFYFDNGIKKSEGFFVNDKKDGKWKFYFENGTINNEITYDKGVETHYREFYENTNPKSDFYLKNNLIEGKAITYYANGKSSADYDYVANKISGTENKFYKNGTKQYTIINKDNNLEGDLLEYYDNGKIKQKVKFVNGKREGQSTLYFNNTKNTVKNEGLYVNGEPTGIWKFYHNNEKLSQEGLYNKNGEKEGLWKSYHSNGNLSEEENYIEGKLNGVSKNFTVDGKLWEEFTYKKNKITDIKSYKENGEVLGEHKLEGKSNVLKLYYPNGTIRKEGLYKNGEMEGVWKYYNAYGVLTEEENYKDGVLDGQSIKYYSNGQKKSEDFYTIGKENAYFKMYHENGKVMREGYLVNDNAVGTWKYYHIDGTLESIKYFNDGDFQGWYEKYDVKGKKTSEDFYKLFCITKIIYYDTLGNIIQNVDLPGGNGVIDQKYTNGKLFFHREFAFDYPQGKSYVYYPDGSVLSLKEYEAGKAVGIYKTYDEFGKAISETPYFNDMKNEKKINYFYNGKIESENNYVDDNLDGIRTEYYLNGKVCRKVNYRDGDAQGESILYDELGELVYIRKYENDILLGYSYNDAKGQLLPFKKIEPGNTKITCYFTNGKKSIEVNYTNGELNGTRTTYCSNGNVAEVESYLNDIQHGPTKSYYSNGNLKTLENYFYGDAQGEFKFYYENGKLRKECYFVNGEEHGLTKYYNEAGVLIKSTYYYDGFPTVKK